MTLIVVLIRSGGFCGGVGGAFVGRIWRRDFYEGHADGGERVALRLLWIMRVSVVCVCVGRERGEVVYHFLKDR